jgi:hypothetical protein
METLDERLKTIVGIIYPLAPIMHVKRYPARSYK